MWFPCVPPAVVTEFRWRLTDKFTVLTAIGFTLFLSRILASQTAEWLPGKWPGGSWSGNLPERFLDHPADPRNGLAKASMTSYLLVTRTARHRAGYTCPNGWRESSKGKQGEKVHRLTPPFLDLMCAVA
jgi:hypothetical protein